MAQGRIIPEEFRIPLLLFRLETDATREGRHHYEACKALLPCHLRQVWETYEQEGEPSQDLSPDGYRMFLSAAVRYGEPCQILRMAGVARWLPPKERLLAARRLEEDACWEAALAIYAAIPERSPWADAEFWVRAGVCLYHLGETALSKEYLEHALQMAGDCPEAKSFLCWIREDGAV